MLQTQDLSLQRSWFPEKLIGRVLPAQLWFPSISVLWGTVKSATPHPHTSIIQAFDFTSLFVLKYNIRQWLILNICELASSQEISDSFILEFLSHCLMSPGITDEPAKWQIQIIKFISTHRVRFSSFTLLKVRTPLKSAKLNQCKNDVQQEQKLCSSGPQSQTRAPLC